MVEGTLPQVVPENLEMKLYDRKSVLWKYALVVSATENSKIAG